MKNKLIFSILLLFLALIPIISLFHPGLPITHDGQDHVARIANFYQNLTEGNLIPRWAANLNWGYGHPILEFLYPLPSYIASFFHSIGFSLVDSIKIVFGSGMVLSFIFMYMWLSEFCSMHAAIFGAILYLYAPYRFVEVYVRGDIGENLSFAFIPLTLYFIYKSYKKVNSNSIIFGGVSLAFLILSHNAISLMLVPFIILYSAILFYLSEERKKFLLSVVTQFIIGFGISFFFWFPALLEGKYTLRNIVTKGAYLNKFVNLSSLIYGNWNYGQSGQFTLQFGPIAWLVLLLSPFSYKALIKDKEKKLLILSLLTFTIASVFLMFSYSNILWSKIILLQNFQFPWRFLAVIAFTTSVLGALFIESLSKKRRLLLTVLLSVIIVVIGAFYAHPKAYQFKSESFYSDIYKSTTDTGESSPIWSVRFMENFPKAHLEVVDGHAQIKELDRKSTNHRYQVNVVSKTLLEENTLYFPGWKITANDIDQPIEYQNQNYRGIMLFSLDKGNYLLDATYEETKLRAISDAISIAILFNIIGFLGFRFVKRYFS